MNTPESRRLALLEEAASRIVAGNLSPLVISFARDPNLADAPSGGEAARAILRRGPGRLQLLLNPALARLGIDLGAWTTGPLAHARALASNPAVDRLGVAAALVRHPSEWVRSDMAANPCVERLPKEAEALSKDPAWRVRAALAANSALPRLAHRAMLNELVAVLAADPEWAVRADLASNQGLAVLSDVWRRYVDFASDAEPRVAAALAANPRLDAVNGTAQLLARHHEPRVRSALAANPALWRCRGWESCVRRLQLDHDDGVLAAIRGNKCPEVEAVQPEFHGEMELTGAGRRRR